MTDYCRSSSNWFVFIEIDWCASSANAVISAFDRSDFEYRASYKAITFKTPVTSFVKNSKRSLRSTIFDLPSRKHRTLNATMFKKQFRMNINMRQRMPTCHFYIPFHWFNFVFLPLFALLPSEVLLANHQQQHDLFNPRRKNNITEDISVCVCDMFFLWTTFRFCSPKTTRLNIKQKMQRRHRTE